MGVLDKVMRAVVQAEATLDRESQLQVEVGAAQAAKIATETDRELAYLEEAEGGPDRIAAAEAAVQAAETRLARAERTLAAHRTIAATRSAEAARKARVASWKQAVGKAEDRVVVAGKLVDALRVAGEQYAEFIRLGVEAYQLMPVRDSGGPSAYRLAPGDAAAVVGIDLLRAGLPDAAQISRSMLDQYPTIADVAASSLDMVRLARREDEGK